MDVTAVARGEQRRCYSARHRRPGSSAHVALALAAASWLSSSARTPPSVTTNCTVPHKTRRRRQSTSIKSSRPMGSASCEAASQRTGHCCLHAHNVPRYGRRTSHRRCDAQVGALSTVRYRRLPTSVRESSKRELSWRPRQACAYVHACMMRQTTTRVILHAHAECH
jgi:hypothetical protein